MKKLALAFLLCGVAAFATPVTYSTSGTFAGGGCAGSTCASSGGGITLTFSGLGATLVSPPSSLSFGDIIASGTTTTDQTFAGVTFTLTVTQTAPPAGSNSFGSATLQGTIQGTGSNLFLQFSSPTTITFVGGGVTTIYSLGFSTGTPGPNEIRIVPPSTNGGDTTIQGTIAQTPEPASLGLIGASLLGLGVLVRRRVKK